MGGLFLFGHPLFFSFLYLNIKTGSTQPFQLHPPSSEQPNQTPFARYHKNHLVKKKKNPHKNLRTQDCTYHALYFNKDEPTCTRKRKKNLWSRTAIREDMEDLLCTLLIL
jgi:hypothetical protein